MREYKNTFLESLLDIIYPRRCPICSEIVVNKGELACISCAKKPVLIKEPRCKKCSKPIDNEEALLCYDCQQNSFAYYEGYALWSYDVVMKKSIYNFKYGGRREYKDFYINSMIEHLGDKIKEVNPDVLIPVPLYKAKKRKRGFNQAELLAIGIGDRLQIPVLKNGLIRNKNTLPQKQLSNIERIKNLEKAFSICHKELKSYGKPILKVMLVDDIYTTGSTVEACTRILKAEGINQVSFICLCIGKGF